MINTAKKAFSILLTVCMLFAIIPVAFAEVETGTIVGDTKLFAPPIGQKSAVPYILKDASGNVVYGIPVHYAIAYKTEGAKEPEVTVIERTERKNVGFASMFAKLSFLRFGRFCPLNL